MQISSDRDQGSFSLPGSSYLIPMTLLLLVWKIFKLFSFQFCVGEEGGNEEMFVAPGRNQRGPRGHQNSRVSLGAQILVMSRIKEDLG